MRIDYMGFFHTIVIAFLVVVFTARIPLLRAIAGF